MSVKTKLFSAWEILRLALKGGEVNILSGNINRAIVLLAIPMVLEMVMESLFAVVDIFFVSKIGVNAIAVVGLTESMLTIVYSIGIGFSMGATAMVARRVGENDLNGAAIAGAQAIYLTVGMSLIIGTIGYFNAENLLKLMGAAPEVIAEGGSFTKLMLGSNVVIMLLFLLNGIFRGAGDATIAMRTLWISNGINIVLDPLLIFGIGPFPEMGVAGAAVATITGRSIGVLYQLYHLFYGKGIIKIRKENWKLNHDVLIRLIKVSAGGTGQFLIASASWIFLMRIMSTFGSAALAGYTVAIRIVVFTLMPAWGISNAAATMVGQNLGAKQPERAEKSVWRTCIFNVAYMGTVMIIYLVFAKGIVNFFTGEADVVSYAINCLLIFCAGYIFYAFGMVIMQAFNGAGDTRTPTIMNFFIFWTFQIPLAYLLSIYFGLGPSGVMWAIPTAEVLFSIIGFLIFRKGKWKLIKV